MFKTVFRAAALMAVVVPTLAAAQYTDPTGTYVVEQKYPAATYPSSYVMNNTVSWDTSIVPFSAARAYTTPEQDTVVNDESRILNAPVYFDFSDGLRDVDYLQKVIPEANTQWVPVPTQTQPSTQTAQVFEKSFDRNEKFGNNLFGGGYAINAYIKATTATTSAPKKVEALGEGYVYGKAFNVEKEIVRGRAYISGQQGGSNTGTAALYALGQQVWSANLTYTFSPAPINWSRTFFSVSKTFMIGPVPVTVSASLSGGVRLSVTGEVTPTVARLTVNAGGFANVSASAGINIVIASFGVSCDLRLVNVNLPTTGELFWPLCSLNWKLKSDLQLNYLAGTLQGFVKVKILFFKKTWKVTIASWPGFTKNFSLLNLYGSLNLGIC
ncbi:hypothetical protein BO221_14605 [Archangium sp. Cb G35]|uniref:hypothetical protein n=1 Tax=Archangium sp. Cb G35 TaxID=1920190 RepID=UPI0009370F20|nr:hypothetical protein [Archangium sp. Cb G35]OJT24390.1 hypothetical protein BO221_14605 [Archangium sp. Cb G35]